MFKELTRKLNRVLKQHNSGEDPKQDSKRQSSIHAIPNEVLEKIFLCVSARDLCKSLCLVCKTWNGVIQRDSFWAQKCLRAKTNISRLADVLDERNVEWSPKEVYFNSSFFTRNLLKNPCGQDQFSYWCFLNQFYSWSLVNAETKTWVRAMLDFYKSKRIQESADSSQFYHRSSSNAQTSTPHFGFKQCVQKVLYKSQQKCPANDMYRSNVSSRDRNNWKIETEQSGTTTTTTTTTTTSKDALLHIFVASFSLAEKMQVVDLCEEGFDHDMLCRVQPDIEVSESYGVRPDCESYYELCVYLISSDLDVIGKFSHADTIEAKPKWKSIRHTFTSLFTEGKVVRFIIFCHAGEVIDHHAGKKLRFCDGDIYGSKMTNGSIKLKISSP